MKNSKSVINIGNLSENLDFEKPYHDAVNMTDEERAETKNKLLNILKKALTAAADNAKEICSQVLYFIGTLQTYKTKAKRTK